jgi:hypothetical protein
LKFLQRSGQIPSDFVGILVGVNAKIAKVATLPTERDMVIKPQGSISGRRTLDHALQARDILFIPKGKGRIVRNEVIADLGLILGFIIGFYEGIRSHSYPLV